MRIGDLLVETLRDEDFELIDRFNELKIKGLRVNQIIPLMGWKTQKDYRNTVERWTKNGVRLAHRSSQPRPQPRLTMPAVIAPKFTQVELDQAVTKAYDKNLTDDQLLSKLKESDYKFANLTIEKLLSSIKKLAMKDQLKVTRVHPPAPYRGYRPTTYEHNIEYVPAKFYDPIFTESVNLMIKLARSGWSNAEIADEVNGQEYDSEQDKLNAAQGLKATAGSVSSTLYVVRHKFGIEIPPTETRLMRTARGATAKGRIIELKKAGKSLESIAKIIMAERLFDVKNDDLQQIKKLITIYLSKLRKSYRKELKNKLGRKPSWSELDEQLPPWLKIEKTRQ